MRKVLYIVPMLLLFLVAGCKSEKKVTTYSDLYKEKPVSILIAPVQDNAKRLNAKTSQDEVVNNELTAAAHYMRQCLSTPLASQGYYTTAPLASDLIIEKAGKDYRKLMNGDISDLNSRFGIDAVLLVAIHKWQQPEVNEVVVYTEYTLRSTKSGMELMHTWVRGNKIQPVDVKPRRAELRRRVHGQEPDGQSPCTQVHPAAADERFCPAQYSHQRQPLAFPARPLYPVQPCVLQLHHQSRRQRGALQLQRRRFWQ